MTRQTTRANQRDAVKQYGYTVSGHGQKIGPGRTNKWLGRHPEIGAFYSIALRMLQNGDRAQRPSWRAVRKMMVSLATAPRIKMLGVGVVPYQLAMNRHERGSWRSFPRRVIDANLTAEIKAMKVPV